MDTNRAKRFSVFQSAHRPTSALPPTTASKRGVTPGKTEANGQEPQPKFTAQQQLHIIERLERGNFVPGAGLQQFHEEFNAAAAAGPSTRKNLLTEFDKLQLSGTSTAGPTLSSTKLSEATDKDDANDEPNLCINLMNYGIHEQNPDAYPCMDLMDKIIVHFQMNIRDIEIMCRTRSEAVFGKLLPPQQLVNLFFRMEAVTRTVKKFMKKSEMERARLFLPPSTFGGQRRKEDGKNQEENGAIRVGILEQEEFFKAIEKVPAWMERVEGFLKNIDLMSDERAAKLKEVISKMYQLVDKLEDGLVRMEANNAENRDLTEKTWECEEDDASTTVTTSSEDYSPKSDITP